MNEVDRINKQLEVTPLDTLKEYAKGDIVEFPPFTEGQPFVARIKRPSLMMLMKTGKIPNALLNTANQLFVGDTSRGKFDESFYKETMGVIEAVAEASFVEPTWTDLKDAGIELTDEQYTFLFNYTQKGIQALEPFREEPEGPRSDQSSESLHGEAKRDDGDRKSI